MAEETKKEVAAESLAVEAPTPVAEDLKADSEKTTVAPPPAEEKSHESKALAVVESKLSSPSLLIFLFLVIIKLFSLKNRA